jgi:two-component system chemotaxis sensor kinase CheA
MDTMASIRQTFFQECEEQLIELENGLLVIQGGVNDQETVNAVFRAVHSIKGGAGAFELTDIVRFAHVFENTLDLVRTGRLEAHPGLMRVMLLAADNLADLVSVARDGGTADAARSAEISADLAAQAGVSMEPESAGEEPVVFKPIAIDFAAFDDLGMEADASRVFDIHFVPQAALYAKGNETAVLFRELGKLGRLTSTCDTSRLPLLGDLEPGESYLAWHLELETEAEESALAEIFEFAGWDSELSIELRPAAVYEAPVYETVVDEAAFGLDEAMPPEAAPKASVAQQNDQHPDLVKAAAVGSPTIRVDLDRVDRLIDLVGELVINQAMLNERVEELHLPRMSPVAIGLDELEQLTREIQDSVMAIRAQPVKSVFQRLPRLVREVAAQTGKTVRLETEGEATEVDKTVIERLIDPLTHMIRNAVDHGLERPDVRLAAGKPAEGVLRLSAAHRSGRIVIEIADDGAGINRERVFSIAVAKGLVPEDAKLSDEEIDNLIFLPGFSTAETISDISGRGVGMDVVRRSIQALGGRIAITSTPGKGSTFTMSLPLTLAVLDGMVVTVADQTLVLPLSTIVEILMPQTMSVHAFGEQSRVIGLRGDFIPLVDLGRRLDYRAETADPKKGVVLLVEADGGGRNALIVDAIQGQRQVVIKSLEANYGSVSGIAAATILGNGRVALILDVDALVADTRVERVTKNAA